MLDAVTTFQSDAIDKNFVKDAWDTINNSSSAKFLLAIIQKAVSRLPAKGCEELKAQLSSRLIRFQFADDALPEAVYLLHEFGEISQPAAEIIECCEQQLMRTVSTNDKASINENRAKTALLVLGEISLVAPKLISSKIVQTVQAVIASDFSDSLKAIAFIVLGSIISCE